MNAGRIEAPWLVRPATQRVLAALTDAGHRALVVGGAVRNAVQGRPDSDIDIATDARPDEVTALARARGMRVIPTGAAHGTVTVVADGTPHEVTTFRRDVETDGRRAVVAFSDDLAQDAQRRDFTMNALYAEADGTLVDPLGGLADARAGRVRFVGSAAQRIAEDHLRILRFFRFIATHGDRAAGIDAEGLQAAAEGIDGLRALSRERIGAEMLRLLAAPDPGPAVAALASIGGLAIVLPGAAPAALPPLLRVEAANAAPPEALRRLAALGGDAGGLRLSKRQARHVHDARQAARGAEPPAVLGYRFGADVARDAILLRAARDGTPPDLSAPLANAERGAAAHFPVSAADLPHLAGPALGRRLRAIEERWLASDLRLDRAALLG